MFDYQSNILQKLSLAGRPGKRKGREFRVFAFFRFQSELSILRKYSTCGHDCSLPNLTTISKSDVEDDGR